VREGACSHPKAGELLAGQSEKDIMSKSWALVDFACLCGDNVMGAEFVGLALMVLVQIPVDAEATDVARQERLRFLKAKAVDFSLSREASPDQLLTLKDEPVLRYSIPERDNGTWDGATFLWLDGTRPVAAVSFGIRKPNNAVFREHTSFSSTPLVCQKSGTVVWVPQTGGLLNRPLPDASRPAESGVRRLAQMRTLARRFSATCYRREDATELRLMPQPLYRFSDEQGGVLDGALFALVVSNDAEMLLLLEATSDGGGGKPSWRFSLARMSSLKHTVRLDDAEIWTIPGFYTIPTAERKTGPYIEALDGKFTASAESSEIK
jgi:hypothetical protein